MSFFADNNSELRDLFFESAGELIQALNEDGLRLEANDKDPELAKRVRRSLHTLKGDSAAAGFAELSGLAHQLEDTLTPEKIAAAHAEVAELVLHAADEFDTMLGAYRRNETPAVSAALRSRISDLISGAKAKAAGASPVPASAPVASAPVVNPPSDFHWTEYEQFVIQGALRAGRSVVNVAMQIDPTCAEAVALQMVRTVLTHAGEILAIWPSEVTNPLPEIRVAVASENDPAWIEHLCRIPAVTTSVTLEKCTAQGQQNDSLWFTPEDEAPASAPTAAPAPSEAAEVETVEAEPAIIEANVNESAPTEMAALSSAHETTLRVDAGRVDSALNLVGELIVSKSMLMQNLHELEKRFAKDPLVAKFANAMAFQSRALSDLQKSVMKIRMVPVEQLFRRFPRVVRDLAKTCGKEVDLQVAGEDTDLDKNILDALAEPLSHIVRNAIDHGFETPAERVAQGKSRRGTLRLNAYHQGNHVVISISDDGRGIDREKLVAKAIAAGAISAEDAGRLNEQEALALVFCAGISTAQQVTAISGRGVGMDVVKSVLERLKGSVSIESQVGKGTTFRLKLPLTLAVIKALMFRVSERLYAIPLASVVEITRAHARDVHGVDKHEVLQLRGEVLTLVRLDRLTARGGPRPDKFFVVVVSHADRKYGLIVDRLLGEEEVVIKALDDHLVATNYVSGASILGDGSVVLILNLQALIGRLASRERDAEALVEVDA